MIGKYNKYLRLGASIKNCPMFKSDVIRQTTRVEKYGTKSLYFGPRLGWRVEEIIARLNG